MATLDTRIAAFSTLGNWINSYLKSPESENFSETNTAISKAFHQNGWFEKREVLHALNYWSENLKKSKLKNWVNQYTLNENQAPKKVAIIAAGNIPMVGLHDVITVMLSGNVALLKCSSSDSILIPHLMSKLIELEPSMKSYFELVPFKLEGFDAVIATGSDNSARHFEQYFGTYPNIIRRNRTGIAILDGNESKEELDGLIKDAYQYFGLGCRNVTKIYIPRDYNLNQLFEASLNYTYLMDNKKFANNYLYHKSLMMMDKVNVIENDLLLLTENKRLYSPVSVINYEYYDDITVLEQTLKEYENSVQCVVSRKHTPFGEAQNPNLNQYADGIDTFEFLTNLNE